MVSINLLIVINLSLLAGLLAYLATKISGHSAVVFLMAGLLPPLVFQLGSYLFLTLPNSQQGASLVVLGIALLPLGFTPLSQTLGRLPESKLKPGWMSYYASQLLLIAFFLHQLGSGKVIEWVTGILDQPIILIEKTRRLFFLNSAVVALVALFCFDATLRNASRPHADALKFVFIGFFGFIVYFGYLSLNVLTASYISESILQSGAAVIFLGIVLVCYGLIRHPFWEVKIHVSRRIIFGCLSFTAVLVYLFISGSILDLLQAVRPNGYNALLAATLFTLVAGFLVIYLTPALKSAVQSFMTRNFFSNKYDYRDLWMQFSEKSSNALTVSDILPRVAEFIADAMFVRQVAVWLPGATPDAFFLAYCHKRTPAPESSLRLKAGLDSTAFNTVHPVPEASARSISIPVTPLSALEDLDIRRFVLIEKNHQPLAVLAVGAELGGGEPSAEDDRLLLSVSSQLVHLIWSRKLAEELLLAREWESFNRFASFVVHDLKNLATLQSMTLENAKNHSGNPEFLADAFATFQQTTDQMISLIAGLSVQRGEFSLKQQPVNILEVIHHSFEDLKLHQKDGVKVTKNFPTCEKAPIISGDPDLLRKVFTNLLLNAVQSLPKGKGSVEVRVSPPANGKITAEIADTGCGIPPEQLRLLFRPFQTTKKKGMGIGLCHTRSIVEVHGGQIRIESRVNAGTKVEIELPTI